MTDLKKTDKWGVKLNDVEALIKYADKLERTDNFKKARDLYRQAAEYGNPKAMYKLASLIEFDRDSKCEYKYDCRCNAEYKNIYVKSACLGYLEAIEKINGCIGEYNKFYNIILNCNTNDMDGYVSGEMIRIKCKIINDTKTKIDNVEKLLFVFAMFSNLMANTNEFRYIDKYLTFDFLQIFVIKQKFRDMMLDSVIHISRDLRFLIVEFII